MQSRYRLDFLSDRASLIGEWSEAQIANLDQAFPEIIKALEAKLLTGELDAQRRHSIFHLLVRDKWVGRGEGQFMAFPLFW
ncbi:MULTISPECIES: type IV toxin-antitoxin system YeeU family antitoxin [unclassified Aeromonas]|uniref:type IV toxin-antitoxin system YeeU family antitoxin n=1 Tax=unclassified Aeromonas TaxID=257493 RepID=UPI003528D7CC